MLIKQSPGLPWKLQGKKDWTMDTSSFKSLIMHSANSTNKLTCLEEQSETWYSMKAVFSM